MVLYLLGLLLQIGGLAMTLIAAVYFFDPANGMGKLLQLTGFGIAAFVAGRLLMRPYRAEAP